MKRTNSSKYEGAGFPAAYAQAKDPHALWWLRLSTALGYRDIARVGALSPIQSRVCEVGGIKVDRITTQPSANISGVVQCLREYLEFPKRIRTGSAHHLFVSQSFRDHLRNCIEAWDKGGNDGFCERWDEGEYLLPGQRNDETTEEFLTSAPVSPSPLQAIMKKYS